MAVGAKNGKFIELDPGDTGPKGVIEGRIDPDGEPIAPRDVVREAAAKLYGQGFSRAQIARALYKHLSPSTKGRPQEVRLATARKKLRTWEGSEPFRDLIYHHAVLELDMKTPTILKGILKKAQRGRVDAARLALEVTGRHNPKGDSVPTQVAVVFNGVPRPGQMQAVEAAPELNGQAVELEEETG